jgi:phenylpropionate dioxygenase-like ring-hydroxylating dioxygenase large terminal subunit
MVRIATKIDVVTRLAELVATKTTTQLDELWTIPADHYTDGERARRERELVLARLPMVVARGSQLPGPGDHLAVTVLGIPLLLVRQPDGSVRALGNACRHRGTQLVEDGGCGAAARFRCPYHGWTYDISGALTRVPHEAESFDRLDKAAFGLTRFPAAERHGFVWVRPSAGDDVIDIAEHLGQDMDAELAAHGIGEWELAREEVFEEPMNWKVVADGILDPYHPAFVHGGTVGPYINNNVYVFDQLGEHTARLVMSKRSISEADLTELSENPSKYLFPNYLLLPNTFMVFQSRHFEVWTIQPHPTDPGRSLTHIRMVLSRQFDDEESRAAYVERNWQLFQKVAYEEDWGVARRAQVGVSGGVIKDTVVGRNEAPLHFFHSFLGRALGDDETSGLTPLARRA